MVRNPPATLIDALFRTCLAIVCLLAAAAAPAQVTLTRGTNFTIDVAPNGRIVFDLLGQILADRDFAVQLSARNPGAGTPSAATGIKRLGW